MVLKLKKNQKKKFPVPGGAGHGRPRPEIPESSAEKFSSSTNPIDLEFGHQVNIMNMQLLCYFGLILAKNGLEAALALFPGRPGAGPSPPGRVKCQCVPS